MSAILPINLTLYGQAVSGISIPIGSTVLWTLDIEDPFTRDPVDLQVPGIAVLMSLTTLDVQGNPVQPPIFTRSADFPDPTPINRCTVPWADTDTAPADAALSPGDYGIDVWTEDGDGNRLQSMATGTVRMLAVATLPDSEITPLPSQDPLGRGPTGPSGTAVETVTGNNAIPAFALIKASASVAGRYELLLSSDDAALMEGVAVTTCSGAGVSFTAQFVPGTVTSMLSDGTGTIAIGAAVQPSTTASGRVKSGSTNVIGYNVGSAVAATLNATVSVR